MAENSLSQLTPAINEPAHLITEMLGNHPAILSTEVAEKFQKCHKHILRYIEQIKTQVPEIFYQTNFGQSFREVNTGNGTVRRFPVYLLTRDAFSLLVMGFTGRAAMLWKIKYIEAFNALEKAALENRAELAREAGYMQGRDEAMSLPMLEAERKKAYLAGLKEGQKYRAAKDSLAILKKILTYRQRGLSYAEIGKILDMGRYAVAKRLERARKAGLVVKMAKPVQGSLLEARP